MKKMFALMCVALLLVGCGKESAEERPSDTYTNPIAPSVTVSDFQDAKEMPRQEVSTVEPMATEEPISDCCHKDAFKAPEGFSSYTYGGAPLSSVYVLLYYTCQLNEDEGTWESLGYEGLPATELMTKLDEDLGFNNPADEAMTDEERENTRSEYLKLILGFSGLCNTEEQVKQFFTGEWVPDGTDYFSEYRNPDGSVSLGSSKIEAETDSSFEREHASITHINGTEYKVWVTVQSSGLDDAGDGFGAIVYSFYSCDGSDLYDDPNFKTFTAEYVGEESNVRLNGKPYVEWSELENDTAYVTVPYIVDHASGLEVIYESDIELYGSDGKLIEKE